VCEIAAESNYDYVVCGHIHHPEIKEVHTKQGTVIYMNSGDWIENLTALEYNESKWSIYTYADDKVAQAIEINKNKHSKESSKEMMASLMQELNVKQQAKASPRPSPLRQAQDRPERVRSNEGSAMPVS